MPCGLTGEAQASITCLGAVHSLRGFAFGRPRASLSAIAVAIQFLGSLCSGVELEKEGGHAETPDTLELNVL